MLLVGPLKLKAQLLCGEELAMGPGKADLLEAIDCEGSISAAGRALGMSYRRTWLLVDAMNRCWAHPLVETIPGGGTGRGARLTACGREVLGAYRALEKQLTEAAAGAPLETLSGLMLAAPKASQSE
ncbi:MAG TPA: LysR family transcriptional regulator [Caulobacteraceae bacterium]|jgi:molybdate transport system regulatory protein|nr:LysR family transcriptional regulator [Caulobacteraceae bacterium]